MLADYPVLTALPATDLERAKPLVMYIHKRRSTLVTHHVS
jgi:hypothetical protein